MITTDIIQNVYAYSAAHAGAICTSVVHASRPSADVTVLRVKRTPSGRYTVTLKVEWVQSTIHTIGGQPIGPGNEGTYGRTHDMSCPGCEGTSFTSSPRSETYWSS